MIGPPTGWSSQVLIESSPVRVLGVLMWGWFLLFVDGPDIAVR